jgi:hypothetical protein
MLRSMPPAWAYTALWLSACGIALVLAARLRGEIVLFSRDYWRTPPRLVRRTTSAAPR